MNRKTGIALVLFVVLLGLAIWVVRQPEKGQRVGERPRPLAKVEQKAIKKLTITAKGTTVVLTKADKGEGWTLLQPVSDAADQPNVDTALETIAELSFGDLVTERKEKHAEYEVDRKNGIHVQVSDGKKTLADLYLGKVMEDFTMLRLAGQDEVYQAVGALRYAFDRELKNWRDRTVVQFKPEQARKLRVALEGQVIQLSRKDDKASWKVDESSTPVDRLDETTVQNLVSTLSTLTAFDFADDSTPQKAGVDKPAATITVTLADNKQHALLVGNHKDEDYWVKGADDPQIFVVKKYTMESLLKRPIDFRDKTVLSLKADDVVALTVKKASTKETLALTLKDGAWHTGGKPVTDDTKVKDAVASLASLTAEGFARNTRAELGLDAPEWTVTVTLKDRSRVTLLVGGKELDGFYGLMRGDRDDLFTLRKYATDRFLLDPKDFNK